MTDFKKVFVDTAPFIYFIENDEKNGKLKEPLENQAALAYNLLRSDRN